MPVLLLLLALLATGCSSGQHAGERTSRDWYEEGLRNMDKRRYGAAIEAFQEAATLYRDANLDADIQFSLAEAFFRDGNYESAVEAYGEFLRLHPRHRKSDKAQFQIGMSYFKQMRGADRSQESTQLALEAFEKVVRNYPRSELAGEAREKIVFCRRRLADHEMYIGRYYFRTKAFEAALPRFDRVYHEFRDLGYGDEALYYLGLCYMRLDQGERARKAWDILMQDYPHSRYLEQIQDGEG